MRTLLLVTLLLTPSTLSAQTRWFEASEQGFRINVPANYQQNTFTEGTDVIHGFLSPDQNVSVRIRTVPVPDEADLGMIIGLFEGSVLDGAQRLVLQDYELNGVPGQMAGYRWNWQGTPVIVGAFYLREDGRFYAIWSAIPENLFQARTSESDAIINTFSLTQVTAQGPSGMGGTVTPPSAGTSIGGTVAPPSRPGGTGSSAPQVQPPAPDRPSGGSARPAASGYVTLVEETAGLEFSIPEGFTVSERSQGQQIWQGPQGTEDADVRMVIQTIDKSPGDYSNVEEAYLTLIRQVEGSGQATEVEKRRVQSQGGLDVPIYVFDLDQGQQTLRFVYALAETANHITMVSFLGPVQRAYRQEIHGGRTAESFVATGSGRSGGSGGSGAVAPPPAAPTGGTDLNGPVGPHVVTLALGTDRRAAGSPSAGYRFWGQNNGFRIEMPTGWSDDNYSGSQLSWYLFSKPDAQAAWRLTEWPQSAKSFEEVVADLGTSRLGTVRLHGTEYVATQSVRHMGPPTNMRLRNDCVVWFHLRSTYSLCFEGDTRTWATHVSPVAEHMLSTLKIDGAR